LNSSAGKQDGGKQRTRRHDRFVAGMGGMEVESRGKGKG